MLMAFFCMKPFQTFLEYLSKKIEVSSYKSTFFFNSAGFSADVEKL